MSEEKRAFPRVDIVCKISTVYANRLLVFDVHTENVGEGGIRVILEEKLNTSIPVDLELFLPNKTVPIKCKGEIVWTSEVNPPKIKHRLFDTGIKFVQLGEKERAEMKGFVSKLL